MKRRQFISSLCAGLFATADLRANPLVDTSPGGSLIRVLTGPAFGTTWRVILPASAPAFLVEKKIYNIIEKINVAVSPWRLDSELSLFNRTQTTDWIPVSFDSREVVRSALAVAAASNGFFDPTVGAMVNRFGFGPITGEQRANFHLIELSEDAVRKLHPGQTLDTCGIAKGYALDLIVRSLARLGIENHYVELGGEIKASGEHPANRPWISGIEQPLLNEENELFTTLVHDQLTLATSGIKHNSYQLAGKLYSHIVSPHKNQSINNQLLSVSVLAKSGMLADAWSTALMAAGEEKGVQLAESAGIKSLFLIQTDRGIRETSVANFNEHRNG
jgi:thiamine biosynthesis lipoprotein